MKGTIIGAGWFAAQHIEAWQRMSGVEIAAVADATPGKAAAFAAQWGIARYYEDAEEMLARERPDFVDLVTPSPTHLALVEMASRLGVHIFCQKPMAPTWKECVGMVEAARASGVRLLMHENWRWQPWFREIRRLVDEGFCGEIFQVGFFMRAGDGRGDAPYAQQPYLREMDRVLVYEMLVHFIDTLRYMAGDVASVYCQLRRVNPVIRGEDCAIIQMTFENGAHGLIDSNRWSGPAKPAITNQTFLIEGTRGTIRMTPEGDLWVNDLTGPDRAHAFEKPEIGYKGDSIFPMHHHFLEVLTSGARCETEGDEYLKTVAVVFACYESARRGEVVRVGEIFDE